MNKYIYIYMPCDMYSNININPEYVQFIDSLEVILTQYAHDDTIICGD